MQIKRLYKENSLLLVIDIQEKIFATMFEKKETEKNINRLIAGAKVLGLPIIWTEQYPKGLGPTIQSIKESLKGQEVLEKITFSCMDDGVIREKVASYGKKQIIVCGIEAHVCVYQTVADLLECDYNVHVVSDATMSRKEANYHLTLTKLKDMGANITSVEMALFELQKVARGETFKAIASIIK